MPRRFAAGYFLMAGWLLAVLGVAANLAGEVPASRVILLGTLITWGIAITIMVWRSP